MTSPLISFVGFEFASRTGPCQVTSKYVLIAIFVDVAWNCLRKGGAVVGS